MHSDSDELFLLPNDIEIEVENDTAEGVHYAKTTTTVFYHSGIISFVFVHYDSCFPLSIVDVTLRADGFEMMICDK